MGRKSKQAPERTKTDKLWLEWTRLGPEDNPRRASLDIQRVGNGVDSWWYESHLTWVENGAVRVTASVHDYPNQPASSEHEALMDTFAAMVQMGWYSEDAMVEILSRLKD